MSRRPDLARQPCHPLPCFRIHRQEVDDVHPVLTVPVAVAHQGRRDRVAVGLVVDQGAAEVVAGEWVEGLEGSFERGRVQPIPLSSSMQTAPYQTMPGEIDGGGNCVGFEVATWRSMQLTITTDAIIVTATTSQCRSVTCEG
jgi:hypothetical protein